MTERIFPGSTACHLVERCRYDWKGEGWLESYIIVLEGKHYRVRFIDVAYEPGYAGSLEPGWEKPQLIDEHRYTSALQLRLDFPPVPREVVPQVDQAASDAA